MSEMKPTDHEVMRQALDAIIGLRRLALTGEPVIFTAEFDRLIASQIALRDALAAPQPAQEPAGACVMCGALGDDQIIRQPVQEPVAWMIWTYGPVLVFMNKDEAGLEFDRLNRHYPEPNRKLLPLYTAPPPQRP